MFYRSRSPSAFTLVEILVVISVMVILIGLLSSAGTSARKKSQIYKAQAMIASLVTALGMYNVDFGAYPDSGNQNMVNYLADTSYSSYPAWEGPYITFKSEDLNGSIPSATLKDPWGVDYRYINNISNYSFDITSAGPDKTFGTADDVKN